MTTMTSLLNILELKMSPRIARFTRFPGFGCPKWKISRNFTAKNGVKDEKFHPAFTLLGGDADLWALRECCTPRLFC